MGRGASNSSSNVLYPEPGLRPRVEVQKINGSQAPAIDDAQAALWELKAAERKVEASYAALRTQCQHPEIIEVSPETSPPLRLCLICGIKEEGWGSGYHVLTGPRERGNSTSEVKQVKHKEWVESIYAMPTEEWGWCCGNKQHPAHGVPSKVITEYETHGSGDGTRCCPEHDFG